jgi:hypothetical protein
LRALLQVHQQPRGQFQPLQAHRLRKALTIEAQLPSHCEHAGLVASVEAQKRDQHQAQGVEELGPHAQAQRVLQALQCFGVGTLVEGQCAGVLTTQQAAGCQADRRTVFAQRPFKIALLDQDAAHQVVGVGRIGILGKHRLDAVPGTLVVARGHLGARHAQAGPGGTGGLDELFEDLARVVGPLHRQQQFGGESTAVAAVGQVVVESLERAGKGHFRPPGVQGLQHVAELALAVSSLQQALAQQRSGERSHQQSVQSGLGRLHHLVVGGLFDHHQEHRAVRQQVLATQFVQQVLAGIRTLVELVGAQDDVEVLALQ